MMTVTHTHFFIDLTSGLVLGLCIVRLGEKISYGIDVLICGMPAHKRDFMFFKPCNVCGWANESAADHIDVEEKLWQALVTNGSLDLQQFTKGKGRRSNSILEFSRLSTRED